jgi:2-oxoisovalerate ferredoxin oxidoreductase delta subunit
MPVKRDAKKIVFESEKDMPTMPMSLGSMLWNKTGSWRNIRPEIKNEDCIQCGICWKFCPDMSILIENEFPVVDYDFCKGCGICAEECPTKCIIMVEERR